MPEAPRDDYPDSTDSKLVDAAKAGPLPGNSDEPDSGDADATDLGVVPNEDNDLDPDRPLDPEERVNQVAGDETVGGINQH
jgi:hypothetical protein